MADPPAGHSGTPLSRKLGFRSGQRIALVYAPPKYHPWLGDLPNDVRKLDDGDEGAADLVIFFTHSAEELRNAFSALGARVYPAGMLWIAWPREASGVATDLTEDGVRAIGLEAGMVDVKVCAVDAEWSGLRFVYRRAGRPGAERATR